MTVQELYKEQKFSAVIYYLNENGFFSLADLETFDFDSLLFVPGIDEAIAYEAKELYEANIDFKINNSCDTAEDSLVECYQSNEGSCFLDVNKSNEKANYCDFQEHIESCVFLFRKLKDNMIGNENFYAVIQSKLKTLDMPLQEDLKFLYQEIEDMIESTKFTPEQKNTMQNLKIENLFANATILGSDRRCGKVFIKFCLENNLETLWDLRNFKFDSSEIKGMSSLGIAGCHKLYKEIMQKVINGDFIQEETVPQELFLKRWNMLDDRNKDIVIRFSYGETLQSIGDIHNLTRERIRQIVIKTQRVLRRYTHKISAKLFNESNGVFSKDDITHLFEDVDIANVCFNILAESSYYIPFLGKIYNDLPNDWEKSLKEIMDEIVGVGVNFYDNLELIEDKLQKKGLTSLDFSDFLSFLVSRGYKLYGDFVARSNQAYSLICYDVVKKHFPFGIKLDSDPENSDMMQLREIVKNRYGNYELPSNNRAITARITPLLILCERGKYCIFETVDYSTQLMDDIVDYINASPEDSLYYSEVFNAFQGRLLMETNIDNYNFLHGILKYLYPDDFKYDRDMVIKIGRQKTSLENRISELICLSGGPISKEYIQKQIPYANDMRLFNAIPRDKDIIQWDYNQFNHMNNISCTDEDRVILKQILLEITEKNQGYCSERTLFEAMKEKYQEFLERNKMTDGFNLFYVICRLFAPEFRFSRPHITSPRFPDIELTNLNVTKFFIGDRDIFSYDDLVSISKICGGSHSFLPLVSRALEEEYIRLNENEYIKKMKLSLSEDVLALIDDAITGNMGESEYVALFAAFNFNTYPNIGYPWNEFILHSVINHYSLNYKILEPRTTDRRYKRGIIVKKTNPCSTYEELVIEQMKLDGITSIHQKEFATYLRNKSLLLTENIPQELYNGEGLRLEEDKFVFDA